MKLIVNERTNIEHERELNLYADGGEHPTHTIEVRNWHKNITMSVRTPQGWCNVPLDKQAAHALSDALMCVADKT
jgi:hypothetical protein